MDISVLRCNDGGSAPPCSWLLAPGVATGILSQLPLTNFSVLAASSPQSVGKSETITVKFVLTEKDEKFVECWAVRYSNDFG